MLLPSFGRREGRQRRLGLLGYQIEKNVLLGRAQNTPLSNQVVKPVYPAGCPQASQAQLHQQTQQLHARAQELDTREAECQRCPAACTERTKHAPGTGGV